MTQKMPQASPGAPALHRLNLGLLCLKRGDMAGAEKLFVEAARLNPAWSIPHVNLGNVLRETGRHALAEKAYRHALQLDPAHAAAWSELGGLYAGVRRDDDALECFRRAMYADPSIETAWLRLLDLLERANRLDEAEKTLKDAKRRGHGSWPFLAREARLLRRHSQGAAALALMEKIRGLVQAESPHAAGFFFDLGQLYDSEGDADKAFACFREAHASSGRAGGAAGFDNRQFNALTEKLREGFTRDMTQPSGLAAREESRSPVFLVGFPRSGTTLLDQILSAHPGACVADETSAVDRMVRHLARAHGISAPREADAGYYLSCMSMFTPQDREALQKVYFDEHRRHNDIDGDRLFIDKMPLNMIQAGFIKQVFPGARFIMMLRHPCDAVLSCYMQKIMLGAGGGLEDIAGSYDKAFGLWEHYTQVMDLDVHTIRYEDIVADFRPTVAALLGFLGLGWDDAVLEFDKAAQKKTRINTPSYHQVTQKIYTRASGRWQRYRKHLEPVLPILAPHALKHGYSMDAEDAE